MKDQSISPEVIILLILTTYSLDCVLILSKEKIEVCHFENLQGQRGWHKIVPRIGKPVALLDVPN